MVCFTHQTLNFEMRGESFFHLLIFESWKLSMKFTHLKSYEYKVFLTDGKKISRVTISLLFSLLATFSLFSRKEFSYLDWPFWSVGDPTDESNEKKKNPGIENRKQKGVKVPFMCFIGFIGGVSFPQIVLEKIHWRAKDIHQFGNEGTKTWRRPGTWNSFFIPRADFAAE